MKRIVCTTSTSCLDYYEHTEDIRTIRIKIDMDGKLLHDGTEIRAEEFYQKMNADKNLVPKTSQPSIGELLELFEGLAKEGYEEAIVTTISSKLSGTYNGICQVKQMLEGTINIIPYDTKTVCFSEGRFALKAAEMIREDKPTEEILKTLDHMKENNKIFFAVDSLSCLVKNGRLSGAAGFIGTFFKIKPILELFPDGTIQAVEKIRTTKKALEGACERVKKYIEGHKDYFIYIAYTGDELKDFLVETIKEKLGFEGLLESPCTPVVGCHVGSQAIGIGVFLND